MLDITLVPDFTSRALGTRSGGGAGRGRSGEAGEGTSLAARKEFKSSTFLTHCCPQSMQGKDQSNSSLGVQDLALQMACCVLLGKALVLPVSFQCLQSIQGKNFNLVCESPRTS